MTRRRYDPTAIPPAVRCDGWDPTRPLLAEILAQMEDLLSPCALVREDELVLWCDYRSRPDGLHKDGTPRYTAKATRSETRTFSLQALLDEQIHEGEALLIALQGDRSRHSFGWLSRIPDHQGDPGPAYATPREVEMFVQMQWGAPRQAMIRLPLVPRAGAGTRFRAGTGTEIHATVQDARVPA